MEEGRRALIVDPHKHKLVQAERHREIVEWREGREGGAGSGDLERSSGLVGGVLIEPDLGREGG